MAPSALSDPQLAAYWSVQALRAQLDAIVPGLVVEALGQIDSTNTELMRRARDGSVLPTLIVAVQQSAGRGRLGRGWVSGAETQSLTFSIGLLLEPRDWSGLSLAVGLALVQSLHPALRLKWPNDVLYEGRKLAGILIETCAVGAARYVVIGVGVNLALVSPEGLGTAPAALGELLPACTAPVALQRLGPALLHAVKRFEAQGFAPFRAGYATRDALLGHAITCSDGQAGVAEGVDADGALLLRSADGQIRVQSADISVRAATAASKA